MTIYRYHYELKYYFYHGGSHFTTFSRPKKYTRQRIIMPEALKRLIDMIHYLPGIGEKTAAKLAFFLLKSHPAYVGNFAKALSSLHEEVQECELCHGLTDKSHQFCSVCRDEKRDKHLLCVVEDYLDMLSIERT